MKGYGEERGGSGAFKPLLAAAGGGILFAASWLALGVPLLYSALAGIAGYGSLWLLVGAVGGKAPSSPGSYVDKELAARTSAEAAARAGELEAAIAALPPRDPLLPRFRRLAELLRAIGRDVDADPKDAESASVFLGLQGSTGSRLAALCRALGQQGVSREQAEAARTRVAAALDRLVKAFEDHLAHLQEDNLAELASELEILDQSLGLEDEFERLRRGGGTDGTA